MRNLFKAHSGKRNNRYPYVAGKKLNAEILDTDEDRVINQYSVYRDYLGRIKRELLHGGAKLIGYRRRAATQ